MIFKTNNEKILEIFMKKPTVGFQVREIINLVKLGNPTVVRGLKILVKKNLINKKSGKIYPFYEANLESDLFKKLKICYNLIFLDKVIKEIVDKTRPNCIILFGSASKGEDTEKSDIDLFIQAKQKEINLLSAEKKIKRKINLLFESDLNKLNKELLNNLVNGIVVYGFMRLK
jgi:predicted nucleotidyltransferase